MANRRAFYEIADAERKRACRYRRSLSLAYIDVDDFKKINDRLGHAIGDELLARTAEILRSNVRASDVVARLGGDEFAVLFPETDAHGVRAALCNLRKALLDGVQRGWLASNFQYGSGSFSVLPTISRRDDSRR